MYSKLQSCLTYQNYTENKARYLTLGTQGIWAVHCFHSSVFIALTDFARCHMFTAIALDLVISGTTHTHIRLIDRQSLLDTRMCFDQFSYTSVFPTLMWARHWRAQRATNSVEICSWSLESFIKTTSSAKCNSVSFSPGIHLGPDPHSLLFPQPVSKPSPATANSSRDNRQPCRVPRYFLQTITQVWCSLNICFQYRSFNHI